MLLPANRKLRKLYLAQKEVLMREELKKKSFRNEAEAGQWWDRQQDALADEFEGAAAAGTLGHGSVARKGSTPTTTIRLDPEEIAKARSQAAHQGLRYQTYLKMLIHQALHQKEAESKTRHS
jgi:predicted DNA binding CopG/RHH family protein